MAKDNTNFIVGGVVLIIIILLGWLLVSKNHTSGVALDTATSTTQGEAMQVTESVSVSDQAAGNTVAVSSMSLTKNSWVAIKDTAAQRILGAAWFTPSAKSGTVELLKGTVKGGKYEAVIYTDDGDKVFDMHKDTLLEGMSGPFTAQ